MDGRRAGLIMAGAVHSRRLSRRVYNGTRNRRDANTSPIQLETMRPIHVGNKCSAATECPEHQHMLSRRCHCVMNTTGQTTERGPSSLLPHGARAVPSSFSMTPCHVYNFLVAQIRVYDDSHVLS